MGIVRGYRFDVVFGISNGCDSVKLCFVNSVAGGEALTARGVMGVLSLVLMLLGYQGKAAPMIEARNLQFLIPSADFVTPAARLSVEKVFAEERHVGFFRVRLLTTEVAQGVRLELYSAGLSTNWQAVFSVKPGSGSKNSVLEWREVSVSVAPETSPRLLAKRFEPPSAAHPRYSLLEGVTIQTSNGPISISRAQLSMDGPARVVFETGGKSRQWDLIAGQFVSDANSNQDQDHL
jgi:hypothetical protein